MGLFDAFRSRPKATGAAAGAALIAALAVYTGPFEGERLKAYRDPVGVVTACYGETHGIKMGMTFTHEQCQQMLRTRYAKDILPQIVKASPGYFSLPFDTQVAFGDFTYNLGPGVYASSIAPLVNAGRVREACDKLLQFDKAGRPLRRLPGLTKRRQSERLKCLKGLG